MVLALAYTTNYGAQVLESRTGFLRLLISCIPLIVALAIFALSDRPLIVKSSEWQ